MANHLMKAHSGPEARGARADDQDLHMLRLRH
jgi:hypothetical protein